jgi:hypothetical protein
MLRTYFFLDYPRETLDPEIWELEEDPPNLKSVVKVKVMKALHDLVTLSGLKEEDLRQLLLVGGETSRHWEEDSDLDITVIVANTLAEKIEAMKDQLKYVNGQHMVGEHPINLFVALESEIPDMNRYDAVYDLIQNKWTKPSSLVVEDPYTEFSSILQKADSWAQRLDLDLGEARRDLLDYQDLVKQLGNASAQTKLAIKKHLEDLSDQLDEDISVLLGDQEELHSMRVRAFEKDLSKAKGNKWIELAQKYKSKNLLPENLVYKVLNRWKYIKILNEIHEIADTENVDYTKVSPEIFA